jgi:hypothetical protein
MQALFYVLKQGGIARHKTFCKSFGGPFEASD